MRCAPSRANSHDHRQCCVAGGEHDHVAEAADATHWTIRSMARVARISEASVRRIWHSYGLKPHRVVTFRISNDPEFAEKFEDIVGLFLNPPEHALVPCMDERSQIQAFDCTQPPAAQARSEPNHDP